MPLSSWRRWIKSLAGSTTPRAAGRRPRLVLETLEDRCVPSVYNPQAAVSLSPAAVEGTALSTGTVLGSFVDFDPVGGLSATVSFNGGGALATTITPAGSEFVPGVGTVPRYLVQFFPLLSVLGGMAVAQYGARTSLSASRATHAQ